ncbi:MAG TPA: hypothetical protein P5021_08595 [Candidatus Diapherotrites archaeon]|nr:hypothetical protein [Candidatus Diapherotrites archaeon]
MNGMYEELLEKLRKNNRMSGWTHIDRLMDDAIKAIEALQQENEQLRAQNSLKWQVIKNMAVQFPECPFCGAKDEERHKESCSLYKALYELTGEYEYDITPHLDKALAEIDKAIGGKEDV